MKTNENKTNQLDDNELMKVLEGYPIYPENEDIYNKFRKEKSIDPENAIKFIETEKIGLIPEPDFENESFVTDLEVGWDNTVEDKVEIVVNEDEDNDYLSLGKDNQLDLMEISGK